MYLLKNGYNEQVARISEYGRKYTGKRAACFFLNVVNEQWSSARYSMAILFIVRDPILVRAVRAVVWFGGQLLCRSCGYPRISDELCAE